MKREVYVKPPKDLDIPEHYVLKVIRPSYVIPESGLYWFMTYLPHHMATLRMTSGREDRCVLFKRNGETVNALILLQVDDTRAVANEYLLKQEGDASKDFICKPLESI